MDVSQLFGNAWQVIASTPQSGLLIATFAAVFAGILGAVMVRYRVPFGHFIRTGSTFVLGGILLVVVAQVARLDPRLDVAVPQMGLPEQVVEGGETRIPLGRDGHFWLQAEVNGVPVNFMVDTGATLTAVSDDVARRANLQVRRGGLPVRLNTANGTISAELASIDELRFGNVAARGLDAVTTPALGDTNVIGMNLLSRLKSWRVEDNTMILVPNNPQPAVEWSGD
ncbi:TIGR02281 family clan AA aspartic protease [Qipengyuania sp. JC766]|uniref:retropepsin-like aspartic protease family protein n=1 Tax=Qipengyuania sp. JC766 TaxID=3232139 RepID=UPI003459E983